MPRASEVNVSAAMAGGAFAGWWVLTLSIVAGVLLGGYTEAHKTLESSIGKVESVIGDVGSVVVEVESSVGEVASDVGEVKSAVAGIDSSVGEIESRMGDVESSVRRVELSIRDIASVIAGTEPNAGITPGPTEVVIGEMNLLVVTRNSLAEPARNLVNNSNGELDPESHASADAVGSIMFDTDNHLIGDAQLSDVNVVLGNIRKEDEDKGRTDDILVLGFADSCGPAAGNLNLSERRAESVAAKLLDQLSGRTIHVFGMGESLGVLGNDLCASQWHRSARVFLLASEGEEE